MFRASSYAGGDAHLHTFDFFYSGTGGVLIEGTDVETYVPWGCEFLVYDQTEDTAPDTPEIGPGADAFIHPRKVWRQAPTLQPFALALGTHANSGSNGTTSLATESGGNAGAVAIPFELSGRMRVQQVAWKNASTASLREAEWAIYYGNQGTDELIRVADGTDISFTPSAIDNRQATVQGAPVDLGPGVYFAVFRNRSTSQTFQMRRDWGSTLGRDYWRTSSAVATLGDTLDISGWSGGSQAMLLRVEGEIGDEGAVF